MDMSWPCSRWTSLAKSTSSPRKGFRGVQSAKGVSRSPVRERGFAESETIHGVGISDSGLRRFDESPPPKVETPEAGHDGTERRRLPDLPSTPARLPVPALSGGAGGRGEPGWGTRAGGGSGGVRVDGGQTSRDRSDRAGHAVGPVPHREHVSVAREHHTLSEADVETEDPDVLQCKYSTSELDFRGSQSEALNVQLENNGDLVGRCGQTGGELLVAFSSGVFDRGKHYLWREEELDNGNVTRLGAEGELTGETAIRFWMVLSESLYGEQSVKGDDGQGHP